MRVPGTWHPATVSTMEWPGNKGESGLYLRYTDGMEEWTAISLFGDTVVEVESTKKMRRSAKDKKRKQGAAESTDKFPESATEWLGYGATVRVKFKGKWCQGTVIGREHEAVMVQYEDGIVTHRPAPRPAHEGMQDKDIQAEDRSGRKVQAGRRHEVPI